MELVQEIHQLLMDREETCHRTCFSLQLNGNTLDNFAELKSIEGLTDGVDLKVVEEPYTVWIIAKNTKILFVSILQRVISKRTTNAMYFCLSAKNYLTKEGKPEKSDLLKNNL